MKLRSRAVTTSAATARSAGVRRASATPLRPTGVLRCSSTIVAPRFSAISGLAALSRPGFVGAALSSSRRNAYSTYIPDSTPSPAVSASIAFFIVLLF
jgi:hypothetical protein